MLTTRDLAPLAASFSGELLGPDDEGYEQRRAIWNRMVDRRPALFARCRSADDARRALTWARENELPVSIMGGGHNVSGSALVDGGMVIDHGLRRGVTLSPDRTRLVAEPGALLGDVDAAACSTGSRSPSASTPPPAWPA